MNPECKFQVPGRLDLSSALAFGKKINDAPVCGKFIFDFAATNWMPPFAMLYLASAIQAFRAKHPEASCQVQNYESLGYPAHMGFFRYFGAQIGNEPSLDRGNDTYMAISELDFASLLGSGAWGGADPQETLKSRCRQLARILCQTDDGALFDTLTYSLTEILRNAFEHSEAAAVSYCAQYWPSKSQVEVAVVDSGIGIRNSLAKNPHVEINQDLDALQKAILPGMSGVFHKTSGQDVPNAGFGLYVLSKLCSKGGTLFLASADAGIRVSKGRRTVEDCAHQGVALRLLLDTSMLQPIEDALEGYVKEGEALAVEIAGKLGMSPSLTARYVSKTFPST